MRFSYVLPDPATYADWGELEGDLACMKRAGYDAVEFQIAAPSQCQEDRLRRSLETVGYTMCAFQTGSTYYSRGNCLCTADEAVRQRTIELLKSFVELAARWNSVIIFGLLQGQLTDEADRLTATARIRAAVREVGQYATEQGAVLAVEPVNHLQVGFHDTIAEVADLVHSLDLPGVRMMVDTFHMNIEEKDMLAPLRDIRDILAHVHLSDSNHGVLGAGHWPTAAFLRELEQVGYRGYCSVGVYNAGLPRRESIERCAAKLAGLGQNVNRSEGNRKT
jgi:sugar phosphate isomerase/epimerase